MEQYEREKTDLTLKEKGRLIQSVYIDEIELDLDLSDCLSAFLRATNVRERDYHKETEFILDFSEGAQNI